MTNNKKSIPYMRKKISPTLLVFSAAIALLLLASSPMLFFNPLLLQPVQAQTTPMTFKTPTPATADNGAKLTFEAHGTNSLGAQHMNGTIQLQAAPRYNEKTLNGTISDGAFYNNTKGATFDLTAYINGVIYTVHSGCSTSNGNDISLFGRTSGEVEFFGPVECSSSSSSQGGNRTTQSSSSSPVTGTTTTQQDSDGDSDGIPDSSDRCTHNSNPKCFKEGGDTSTTAQQQSSSTSNRTGNQTR